MMLLLLFSLMLDPVSDIRALLTRQTEAWNRGDLKGFLDPYLHTDELTFFSGDTVTRGFAAIQARYERRYGTSEKKDRKSTRLNSSHQIISYAVFSLKKKTID